MQVEYLTLLPLLKIHHARIKFFVDHQKLEFGWLAVRKVLVIKVDHAVDFSDLTLVVLDSRDKFGAILLDVKIEVIDFGLKILLGISSDCLRCLVELKIMVLSSDFLVTALI